MTGNFLHPLKLKYGLDRISSQESTWVTASYGAGDESLAATARAGICGVKSHAGSVTPCTSHGNLKLSVKAASASQC